MPQIMDNNNTYAQNPERCLFSKPCESPSGDSVLLPNATSETPPSPRIMSGYISTEDHERAMRQNVKLSQELKQAREETAKAKLEAEQATKAFRKLAEWTYNERGRILAQLAGQGEAYSLQILGNFQEPNQPFPLGQRNVNGSGSVSKNMNQQRHKHITNVVYTGDISNSEIKAEDGSEQVDDYEPPDAARGSSIVDQVDELIAEEKGRLSFAEF